MVWVTAAGLTALLLSIVPMIGRTLVTVMARHVLPAGASSSLLVTVTLPITAGRMDGTGSHTGATSAVVGQSAAIVTMLTLITGRTNSVVQAFETLASCGVT